MSNKSIRVAILDLYEGAANEGMRCIRQILSQYSQERQIDLDYDEFDVRLLKEIPGLDYDIYISSGGPGSPLGDEDSGWEELYFNWLKSVEDHNCSSNNASKKYVLFICHSFQMACRYFEVGNVARRKSTAFGVFPVHLVEEGKNEPVFSGLPDPFYAVDSRDYQVIEPDYQKIETLGATVLAIEKERPHVPLERAVMALRFNEYMLGTQFHPEADPEGMTMYLQRNDKKDVVIQNHGYDKWQSMIDHLNDPDKISWTYSHVIPNFFDHAMERLLII
jgi:homoserine O-succinyltransferase/O-acetyltransferase